MGNEVSNNSLHTWQRIVLNSLTNLISVCYSVFYYLSWISQFLRKSILFNSMCIYFCFVCMGRLKQLVRRRLARPLLEPSLTILKPNVNFKLWIMILTPHLKSARNCLKVCRKVKQTQWTAWRISRQNARNVVARAVMYRRNLNLYLRSPHHTVKAIGQRVTYH